MNRMIRLGALALLASACVAFVTVPRFADADEEENREVVLAPVPLSDIQGGHLTTDDPRSPVIYPKQKIGITFHHKAHVQGIGETCDSCHPLARKSDNTKDLLVPAPGKCMECHKTDKVPWVWGKDVANSALDMPGAHLKFSHAEHMKQDGIKCLSCHQGVDEAAVATVDHLPTMEKCIACHQEKGAPTGCRTCHESGRAGTIRTAYSTGTLLPDDHGVFFQKQHGMQAQADLGYCASCHAQEDCLSCHDGAIPPTFHASNYLQLHPQDAMANNPTCGSCHRLDRFCRDCHFKSQVTLGSPLGYGDGSFHGADWMSQDTPDFHGNIGRKNLESCTACHVKNDCLSCHAFYDGAPEIHPAGWANSSRMRNLRNANVSMCLECHGHGEPGDPFPGP